MFSETAAYYEALYETWKDFDAESDKIAALLREEHPGTRTVLDAACGTGRHAEVLTTAHGFAVDGFDLDAGMVRIAADRNRQGRFDVADMVDFDLGRRYDAVICLFSSIGYVRTLPNLERALRCFGNHVKSDGVILVEPWFPPGVLEHGRVVTLTAEAGDTKLCRMSRTTIAGRISRIDFEYLIGDPGGIRRESETHELGLFTQDEMIAAFRAADLAVRFDPQGLTGRGLYVGRHGDDRASE